MKIVVVGAGYAGTIAANRLLRKVPDARITLVNPRRQFIERVRLHEELAGTGSASTLLAHIVRSGINTVASSVDKIGDGTVLLESGETLEFDHAFIAVGSTVNPMHGTIPVGTWEGAQVAKSRLDGLAPGSNVTVIGGGLTGIETAAEIAYARPHLHVSLVAPAIAASLSQRAAARTRRGLDKLRVVVIEDSVTGVHNSGERDVVVLASGRTLASDVTLWGMIGTVPDLVAKSGLEVDEQGRAVVDRYLRSTSDSRIFVVGDCAAVPGARPSCATASPQGAHAADTLARIHKGRKPKPYSMGYTGQALSLGRRDGILMASRRDDTPRNFFIAGRPAAVAKESVNRYAEYGSRTANYWWIGGAR